MIAAAGWWQLEHLGPSPLDAGADPNLRLAPRLTPDRRLRPPPAPAPSKGPRLPAARGARYR